MNAIITYFPCAVSLLQVFADEAYASANSPASTMCSTSDMAIVLEKSTLPGEIALLARKIQQLLSQVHDKSSADAIAFELSSLVTQWNKLTQDVNLSNLANDASADGEQACAQASESLFRHCERIIEAQFYGSLTLKNAFCSGNNHALTIEKIKELQRQYVVVMKKQAELLASVKDKESANAAAVPFLQYQDKAVLLYGRAKNLLRNPFAELSRSERGKLIQELRRDSQAPVDIVTEILESLLQRDVYQSSALQQAFQHAGYYFPKN